MQQHRRGHVGSVLRRPRYGRSCSDRQARCPRLAGCPPRRRATRQAHLAWDSRKASGRSSGGSREAGCRSRLACSHSVPAFERGQARDPRASGASRVGEQDRPSRHPWPFLTGVRRARVRGRTPLLPRYPAPCATKRDNRQLAKARIRGARAAQHTRAERHDGAVVGLGTLEYEALGHSLEFYCHRHAHDRVLPEARSSVLIYICITRCKVTPGQERETALLPEVCG